MKLSNYVAQTLVANGIDRAFMITGGGAMHLNDAFGKTPGLKVLFNHHEQACAIAAEGYARTCGKPALVSVTTGPGGTNAITGLLGAWQDSVPMLVISGQVRFDTTVRSTGRKLRQLGDQEVDIVELVKSITKYAVCVSDPRDIRYHLERAMHLCRSGRPGPVWLDIPLNVQAAEIDPAQLAGYNPVEDAIENPPKVTATVAKSVLERLRQARRPVIMIGSGVRASGALPKLLELSERIRVPMVTAFNAHDALPDAHPLYVGRPGTVGDRPGNFAVQSSDFLLVLGCRLNIRQIGYFWTSWARAAYKVMVDIDHEELHKPTLSIDLPVHADLNDFLRAVGDELGTGKIEADPSWLSWCLERRKKYPVVLPEYWERKDKVNPYCFVQVLGEELAEDDVIVTGNGGACVCTFQGLPIKKHQRLFSNSGCASMGYDLPAAMGACFSRDGQRAICIAGDGSILMNLQELLTVAFNRMPVKIFLVNNGGYHSIRQTQENFFGKPLVGCDPESGVGLADMGALAKAFGIPYFRAGNHAELRDAVRGALAGPGPALCEIIETIEQPFAPKASSYRKPDGRIVSRPLEDLAPFLDREEFKQNLLIPPLEE